MISKVQADNALNMHAWISTPVKVTPHRSLNTSNGVIRCREIRDCSDEELLEALCQEKVTNMKHVYTKKNVVVVVWFNVRQHNNNYVDVSFVERNYQLRG
jgi:hypothetical protein